MLRSHQSRRLSVVALVGMLFVALTSCTTTPDTYVALGDSYVAGPLIPDQSTSPLGCLRSNKNYPALIAPTLGVANFVDVSCSGAQTREMTVEQGVTPGPPNPPQLDAINARTKVVTLGIGGNDIGFSNIVKDCLNLDPNGPPCKNKYVTASGDELLARIAATQPKVSAVVAAIRAKAPAAKVFVVGYPSVLPDTGNGCHPSVPIVATDVVYLRGITKALNAMVQSAAVENGATFIDAYTPTIGHDACAGGNKWVEGLVPGSWAAPVHPNAAGMRGQAEFIGPIIQAALAG